MTIDQLARGRGTGGLIVGKPYWWEAAPPVARTRPSPSAIDVAIIGSGFTGLSAALTLLRRGRSVAVFDRATPGFGASTRNGGQVGSGNQKFRVKRLIELHGERKAVCLLKEGVAMLDFIAALIAREKIECGFRRAGRFRGAVRPEHYESMARDMEDLRHHAGVESFMVPRAEQHREIGSDRFYGGSVLPGDGSLHPSLYHRGLMTRVEEAGGLIAGDADIRAIAPDRAGFAIHAPHGAIHARDVIVATNGYSRGLDPYFDRRIFKIGSAIIATAPLPEATLDALMPTRRMYGNTNRVFFYFRATDDNRILWGGRTDHVHPAGSPRAYSHLANDLLRTFPQLKSAEVTHAWSGQIGYTFDALPHLGKNKSGIHYAMGYCGTGVSRSTYFGHKIALQVLGDPDGKTAFDDIAFPSHPFYFAAERMAPVVETWYRFRDLTSL
ncbi:MAG: NAD(P)/FAD-dependent oxidoreductase [Pseudorhodoplanes sp.]